MGSKASTRRFEYKDDKSSKFWEISVTGEGFIVRYGKIGTDGQTQAKEYADAATAEKQAQKLIAEKVGKGYLEVAKEQATKAASLLDQVSDVAAGVIDPDLTLDDKFELAESNNTAPEILLAFATNADEDSTLRTVATRNPSISQELLFRLSKDRDLVFGVAQNPNCPLELLEQFSKLDDEELRCYVAANLNCSVGLLEQFSKIKDDELRCNVAANPNCPDHLLKKWAKLKNEGVRESVASNPSSPIEILELLATDDEARVRMMLAGNPACPKESLLRLSEDADTDVRRCVAESDQCPVDVLASLESDPDPEVVCQVASNRHTPLAILERLATHDEGKVRLGVAENPACPPQLQKIALTIPTCSFPRNDLLASVMEPVIELMNLIDKARSEFPDHPFLDHHGIKDIGFCAPAWNLKMFDIPTQYADRTRSMLEGPFFTCEKYPWPSGGETKYASPVVQLDLREITRLRGQDYGDGLLQVFLTGDLSSFEVRVIPRSDVEVSQMTPVVQGVEDDFYGYLTQKYWLGYGGFVSQIIGYEEPVLSSHVYADDGAPEDDDPPVFAEIFERMESLTENDSGIHMFGTFYPIQYRHSEVGGELLMALDSDLCYGWGDSGNAQIFVTRNEGGAIIFSAMWSCY